MSGLQIKLNGEDRVVQGVTVAELLGELGLGDRKVAVELNKELVFRGAYQATRISNGDSVEIVHFVGGG